MVNYSIMKLHHEQYKFNLELLRRTGGAGGEGEIYIDVRGREKRCVYV